MLPFIPLILSLAPQIAKWIFGEKGSEVTKEAAVAIQTVTGADASTTDGLAAAKATLDGKPELVLQLQQRLAEISATREAEANREADARRQSDIDELKQNLQDVASARAQTVTLASSGSLLAWGSAILSAIILLAFAVMLYAVISPSTGKLQNEALVNVLFGTLAAMATQVANYWLGSSSGSARKNDILREQSSQLAASTPGPAVQTASVSETPGAGGRPGTTTATATTQPLQSLRSSPSTKDPVIQSAEVQTDELNQRSLDRARQDR